MRAEYLAIAAYTARVGIGKRLIQYLWMHLGLNKGISIRHMHKTRASRRLSFLFARLDDDPDADVRRVTVFNIGNLISIRCYRGLRHRSGHPTRGQRTRSNYKTARRLNRDVTALVADLTRKVNPIMRRKHMV